MPGKGEQGYGQCGEQHHVNGTIEGDQPEHVAIPQHRSPIRKSDLGAGGHRLDGRRTWYLMREPAVTAKAAEPANAVCLSNQQIVILGDPSGILANNHVTSPRTGQQLVAVGRSSGVIHHPHHRLLCTGTTEEAAMEIDVNAHAARIADHGYTILEDAIDMDLINSLDEYLRPPRLCLCITAY